MIDGLVGEMVSQSYTDAVILIPGRLALFDTLQTHAVSTFLLSLLDSANLRLD